MSVGPVMHVDLAINKLATRELAERQVPGEDARLTTVALLRGALAGEAAEAEAEGERITDPAQLLDRIA